MTDRSMTQGMEVAIEQESVDAFYWSHGPCCAGCDWWRGFNSSVGECLASPPVSHEERWAMTGATGISLTGNAGHIVTMRQHHCGKFKDDFDWQSLPLAYLKRVGAPLRRERSSNV